MRLLLLPGNPLCETFKCYITVFRRVLSSLDWGSETDLFLPQSVHDVCAETIVKAHVVHCKNRNSLISKSVAKAAKLALKCPDIEQGFDRFCHDLLIRLKISEKVEIFIRKGVLKLPEQNF